MLYSCQHFVLNIREISTNERMWVKNEKCTRGCGKEDFEIRESHSGYVRIGNHAVAVKTDTMAMVAINSYTRYLI